MSRCGTDYIEGRKKHKALTHMNQDNKEPKDLERRANLVLKLRRRNEQQCSPFTDLFCTDLSLTFRFEHPMWTAVK